jgi:ectoine hydroxylase-related dioxygenase (phytanoyl-CoA dioxygenase family)
MRNIFHDESNEKQFREDGYVIFDLLDAEAIADLFSFYAASFPQRRQVVPFARELPYYISIFDCDLAHKREVDERISRYVMGKLDKLLDDYEVFYSNFMIKFPGDGQIEAHQDFNFVDESQDTAFNLWCPLVDTDSHNGGLYVIAGSHNVFRTQRGPNLPKALTQYNDILKRYARCIPLRKGQAAIFDHKLVHYSPPNLSQEVRVAIQSVLKPRNAAAVHYVFDQPTQRVRAYRIDKEFILNNNLWDSSLGNRTPDHEQPLIPLPTPAEVQDRVINLAALQARRRRAASGQRVLRDDRLQQELNENGFVTLPLLGPDEVACLKELFRQSTGGSVENTTYGMYIGLEETDLGRKCAVIQQVLRTVLPQAEEHFVDCKPHLGSFLVKAPGAGSYTYPHQDWTFVDTPQYRSMTVWTALVDVDENNGALGFVPGSHTFFDHPIGSPSPDFATCAQGHEAILYEYLQFVPLSAGQAVVFDNRTIHGATPNRTDQLRLAVAIGMTPRQAQLYHYFLVPQTLRGSSRRLAKLKVDCAFFEKYTVTSLKKLYDANQIPGDCEIESVTDDEFEPFPGEEIRKLCECSGLRNNGQRLAAGQAHKPSLGKAPRSMFASPVKRLWATLFRQ